MDDKTFRESTIRELAAYNENQKMVAATLTELKLTVADLATKTTNSRTDLIIHAANCPIQDRVTSLEGFVATMKAYKRLAWIVLVAVGLLVLLNAKDVLERWGS